MYHLGAFTLTAKHEAVGPSKQFLLGVLRRTGGRVRFAQVHNNPIRRCAECRTEFCLFLPVPGADASAPCVVTGDWCADAAWPRLAIAGQWPRNNPHRCACAWRHAPFRIYQRRRATHQRIRAPCRPTQKPDRWRPGATQLPPWSEQERTTSPSPPPPFPSQPRRVRGR